MYHEITLIGRLGRDPEMRYTPSGVPVTTLSVATDDSSMRLRFAASAANRARYAPPYLTMMYLRKLLLLLLPSNASLHQDPAVFSECITVMPTSCAASMVAPLSIVRSPSIQRT
mgnify:CR=1 FL=1